MQFYVHFQLAYINKCTGYKMRDIPVKFKNSELIKSKTFKKEEFFIF